MSAPGYPRRRLLATGAAVAASGLLASCATPSLDPGDEVDSDSSHAAEANLLLRERFVRARGGVIGTGGRAVVAFRWDHHPVKALDQGLVDLHRTYAIPLTWAHYSHQREQASHATEWSVLEEFALFDGMEVGCHSQTHTDAPTEDRIIAEIVTSLTELNEALPRLMIEWFIIPGVGGTNYNGFISTNHPDKWYGTPAGLLVLQNYAMCSGHMAGTIHPLNGEAQIGLRHNTIEKQSADQVIATIGQLQDRTSGSCFMIHPSVVGSTDGMSVDEYETVLAHVAAERDAGRLLPLTMSGLAVADAERELRDQLLTDADLSGDPAWQNSGWTIADGGATTETPGAALRQEVSLSTNAYAIGGVRELEIECRSATGATVTLERWTDTREHTIAAGSDWQTLRAFGVIPNGVDHYPIGVVAGEGHIEIRAIRLLAA